jgi:hypothetical protein
MSARKEKCFEALDAERPKAETIESTLQVKRSTHDLRWSKTMLHLSESDLRFLVETVATNRRDYDYIVNLVRDKEDLLEPMLEDPKLTERLFRDE